MDGDLVSVQNVGRVAVVSMRRESRRNAVNRELADALDDALNHLEDDTDIWAGVLTGTDMVFSAGSDLTAGGDYVTERGGEYGIIRRSRQKPLIAAVEGPALGGGLEIVLSCDLVVASATARFGLPEVARGVVPTCAALFRAPRAFPVNLARELILTGEPIDAPRAHAAGFVNVLTDPGEAVDEAIRLAERVCQNSPLAVRACLAAVNGLLAADDEQGWEATVHALETIHGTDDRREGVTAFLEHRRPIWRAR